MSAAKCAVCGKTAYPLESLTALEKTYHKICFKCDVCKMALNIKNYKGVDGKVYCATHTPVDRSSTGSDSLQTKTALAAPKKVAEGLGTAQKGTGETPNCGLDSVVTKTALNAPKKVAEGLGTAQKGTGETPNVGLDSVATKSALTAPKVKAENIGTVHKGDAITAPQTVVDEQGQPIEEAPAESDE